MQQARQLHHWSRARAQQDESLIEPGAHESRCRRIMRRLNGRLDALHDEYTQVDQDLKSLVRQWGIAFSADRQLTRERQLLLVEKIAHCQAQLLFLQRSLHAAVDARESALRSAQARVLLECIGRVRLVGCAVEHIDGPGPLVDLFQQVLETVPSQWGDDLNRLHITIEAGPRPAVFVSGNRCQITTSSDLAELAHLVGHVIDIACPTLSVHIQRRLDVLHRGGKAPLRVRYHQGPAMSYSEAGEILGLFMQQLVGTGSEEFDESMSALLIALWLHA